MSKLVHCAAIAFALSFTAAGVHAQSKYPTKPIRMIVPFTPGSATDIIARIIAPRLSETLGRQIVVDNRPSAGGIVAFNIVAEATPDGHTLTTTGSNFAGSAALYAAKLPYDPVRDFTGITQIASTPLILVVGSSLGAKSVKELIALAKQKPGQLNFGSSGIGSGPHYGAALFHLAAGINVVHIPYRGSPEAFTDMIAGRVDYFFSPIMAAVPYIKSGRVLALGVTTAQRAPPMPEVPTIAEAGLAGFVYQGWYGLLAPGKTPRKIVNLLSSEIGRIVDLPDIKERIASQGAAAVRSTPEEFDKLVRDEIRMRTKVWHAAGVKVE